MAASTSASLAQNVVFAGSISRLGAAMCRATARSIGGIVGRRVAREERGHLKGRSFHHGK